MLAPWVTPHLTVGQLVFAICATAYVLAATGFEEADLIEALGDRYRAYRAEVPAFLPRLRRGPAKAPEEPLAGPTNS
jgi:methanethiol S-methyltransferase